ncbi:hypothetical protein Hanom_Chr14g01251941 [Helianthus anomalus]
MKQLNSYQHSILVSSSVSAYTFESREEEWYASKWVRLTLSSSLKTYDRAWTKPTKTASTKDRSVDLRQAPQLRQSLFLRRIRIEGVE